MSRKKIEFDAVVLDSVVATLRSAGVSGAKKSELLLGSSVSSGQFLMVMSRLLDRGSVVRTGSKRGTTWFLTEFAPAPVVVVDPVVVATVQPAA